MRITDIKHMKNPKRGKITNFSYRSGVECSWRCNRAGYLEQFYLGGGIVKSPKAYWLDLGVSVHEGLAKMLEIAQLNGGVDETTVQEFCIAHALHYWDTCGQHLVLHEAHFAEQRILIEALLWAFYYHTLPTFLQTFEVLYVEQEITEVVKGRPNYMMMSRPDGILRDRLTGEIVVLSWKTIDDPNEWRRLFFKQDLQGMMEGWYTEQFLQDLLCTCGHPAKHHGCLGCAVCSKCNKHGKDFGTDNLGKVRISYVQTIYLVKGKREKIKGDGVGMETGDMFSEDSAGNDWRQNSHLVYAWSNLSQPKEFGRIAEAENVDPLSAPVFESLAWKYRYVKPGNVSLSTLGTAYKKTLVTNTSMSVREWVKALHDGVVFPSTLPTEAGKSALSKVVVWENPSYRDENMMKSVIQQVKEVERKRHRDKKILERMIGVYEQYKDSPGFDIKEAQRAISYKMDMLFPQQLVSCSFPWRCAQQYVCHTEEGRTALVQLEMPRGYTARSPHHDPERVE